jgi:hypothetical protein
MEEFKVIIEHPDYEISNFGRVKNNRNGKFLKHTIDQHGYHSVCLYNNIIKEVIKVKLHRLLGLYFIPNPENKRCIDHIDRDLNNNSLNNLRWATNTENMCNRSIQKNNKTGYVGVKCFEKRRDKNVWRSEIRYNRQHLIIGFYPTIELAVEARRIKEQELFKDFKPLF